jgi:cytochrome P450
MSYGNGTRLELFFHYGMERLPSRLIPYLPIMKFFRLRVAGRKLANMAEKIVQDKVDALAKGLEGGKDLMSLLVRANANQKPSERLSDREVISEIA